MPSCLQPRPSAPPDEPRVRQRGGRSIYHDLLGYLRCPVCEHQPLTVRRAGVACESCGEMYREHDGILDFAYEAEYGKGPAAVRGQARDEDERDDRERPCDHEVALGFAAQRVEYLKSILPLDDVYSAVDVGAGSGISTHCLEPDIHTIFSTDLARRRLMQNPCRFRLRTDACNLPLRDRSVDMAYAWELLYQVDEPRKVLAEMRRVARKYVYVFEPNCWNPVQAVVARLHEPHRFCRRNTRAYLVDEGKAAGLRLMHYTTAGWTTPNRTPRLVYRTLRHLPFPVPWFGLSHFLLFTCD